MAIKISYLTSGFILLLALSTFYFFQPVFWDLNLLKIGYWTLISIGALLSIKVILYSPGYQYSNNVRLFIIAISLSVFSSYLIHGQEPILTLRASFTAFGYCLYFFLIKYKPVFNSVICFIFILLGLYLIAYFIGLIYAPVNIFGNSELNISDQRGIFRLYVPGRGFLYLGFFYAICKVRSKKWFIWGIVALLLFSVIFIQVIRQYIFFTLLLSAIILLRKSSILKKVSVSFLLVIVFIWLYNSSEIIQALVELTHSQLESRDVGDENVRVSAYQYFFTEFMPNTITVFFGNGVPHASSRFGYFYTTVVNEQYHFYMSDVGYAQIFSQFGLFGLVTIIFLFIKVAIRNVSDQYRFAKYYIIFVALSTLMSDYFLSYHSIASISIALYILELDNKERKRQAKIMREDKIG